MNYDFSINIAICPSKYDFLATPLLIYDDWQLSCWLASWALVCCRRQPKIKLILLKIYVVMQVRIIPMESI